MPVQSRIAKQYMCCNDAVACKVKNCCCVKIGANEESKNDGRNQRKAKLSCNLSGKLECFRQESEQRTTVCCICRCCKDDDRVTCESNVSDEGCRQMAVRCCVIPAEEGNCVCCFVTPKHQHGSKEHEIKQLDGGRCEMSCNGGTSRHGCECSKEVKNNAMKSCCSKECCILDEQTYNQCCSEDHGCSDQQNCDCPNCQCAQCNHHKHQQECCYYKGRVIKQVTGKREKLCCTGDLKDCCCCSDKQPFECQNCKCAQQSSCVCCFFTPKRQQGCCSCQGCAVMRVEGKCGQQCCSGDATASKNSGYCSDQQFCECQNCQCGQRGGCVCCFLPKHQLGCSSRKRCVIKQVGGKCEKQRCKGNAAMGSNCCSDQQACVCPKNLQAECNGACDQKPKVSKRNVARNRKATKTKNEDNEPCCSTSQ